MPAAACAMVLGAPAAIAQRSTHISEPSTGEVVDGYKLFQTFSCGACHTLRAAGPTAYGQIGMNFNRIHAPYVVAVAVITNGLPAGYPFYPTQMPLYGKVLTSSQIRDLAAFVSKYSGGYKTCAACTAASASS
jgi:mono/diheme cytochrome c family protein